MQITDVKAVYPNYQHVAPSWRTNFWQIVVRVETDLGVVGLGYGGGGIASVEIVNRHFRELMLGSRVDTTADIAALWDDLYLESLPYGRKGLAVMALSGVDLALWDLLGKAENKPVHQLIGPPTRERVRVYATGMDTDWYADLGITGQKLRNRWRGDPMVGWAGSTEQYDQAVAEVSRARRSLGTTPC
jgi:L-rhamnonate dehydratase